MSRAFIIAVIITEGIGLGYFGGYLVTVGWFIFWILIAWWSLVEVLMERHNGS